MPTILDETQLRSEEVQDILEKVPGTIIRRGNTIIFSIVLLAGLVAFFIKYPDTIEARCIITTDVPLHKIFMEETSTLSHLLVKEGDLIMSNQPLAILENSARYKDVLALETLLDTVDFKGSVPAIPFDQLAGFSLGELSSVYEQFENRYLDYLETSDHESRQLEASLRESIRLDLTFRLERLKAQKRYLSRQLIHQKAILNRNQLLFEQKVIAKQDLEVIELAYHRFMESLESVDSSIAETKYQLDRGRLESEISRTSDRHELTFAYKRVLHAFKRLKNAISEWKLRFVITSAVSGVVHFNEYWHIHEQIMQGVQIFTIVPDEKTSYVGILRVSKENFGKVRKGQKVYVALESYPEEEFGVILGRIVRTSEVPDDAGFYVLEMSVPQDLRTSYDNRIRFINEMGGVAQIFTEDRRLTDHFIQNFGGLLK